MSSEDETKKLEKLEELEKEVSIYKKLYKKATEDLTDSELLNNNKMLKTKYILRLNKNLEILHRRIYAAMRAKQLSIETEQNIDLTLETLDKQLDKNISDYDTSNFNKTLNNLISNPVQLTIRLYDQKLKSISNYDEPLKNIILNKTIKTENDEILERLKKNKEAFGQ